MSKYGLFQERKGGSIYNNECNITLYTEGQDGRAERCCAQFHPRLHQNILKTHWRPAKDFYTIKAIEKELYGVD